jgi:hypothetical protein
MVKIDDVRIMLNQFVEELARDYGFKERKYSQGGGLIKKTKTISEVVGWGMLKAGSTNHEFMGFTAYNCHNQVHEITKPILRKYKLIGGTNKDLIITFHPKEGLPMSPNENIIFSDLTQLNYLKDAYRDFFVYKAIPYFERWNSVNKVYEVIKDIKEDTEIGLGQFPHYEKAVIMRLCNDKNYKDYFYEYYKSKEMYHLNDPTNEDCLVYLNAAKEMLDQLDEIKPIYNL